MLGFLVLSVSLSAFIAYICFFREPFPPLVLGVGLYTRTGRWFHLKKYLFWWVLLWRKHRRGQLFKRVHQDDLLSFMCPEEVVNMEGAQPMEQLTLLDHDAMFFNGLHADGTSVVLRIVRRQHNSADIWLCLSVPTLGVFTYPSHPATAVLQTSDASRFSAAGLSFECAKPMCRWKITFNGLLRRGHSISWPPDNSETVHVKFTFTWVAFTESFHFEPDTNLFRAAVAREKWTGGFFKRLEGLRQTEYEQWGELRGSLEVKGHPTQVLRLRGIHNHRYGNSPQVHRSVTHLVYVEDGNSFHVGAVCMPGILTHLQRGYRSSPNALLTPVTWTDLSLPDLGENKNPPDDYSFALISDGKSFHFDIQTTQTSVYYEGEQWDVMTLYRTCRCKVNGIDGYGASVFSYRHSDGSPVSPPQQLPLLKPSVLVGNISEQPLAVCLDDATCTDLVGGKASQLALLRQIETQEFVVPNGVCLTFAAFQVHLEENSDLENRISMIEAVASGRTSGDLQAVCEDTVSAFTATPVCTKVRDALMLRLEQVFSDGHQGALRFAVRSSAAGEDSRDLSSAGQLNTVLGVASSLDNTDTLLNAVTTCWASLFSYTAVEYRRQHGQPIRTLMAVLVQEMVPARIAGVLFTIHPVTGNPAEIVINANYGLGQSVVSGHVEPDKITVHRTWEDTIRGHDTVLGSKRLQIHMSGDGSIEETSVAESDEHQCCIEDDMIDQLANIGLDIEKRFRDAVDIEWAICDRTIYILQARPITARLQESDEDLMHDLDSPLVHDRELLTTANTQEALPIAATPLSGAMYVFHLNLGYQLYAIWLGMRTKIHAIHKCTLRICGLNFLNINYWQGVVSASHSLHGDKRYLELSIFGETIDELTQQDIVSYHGTEPFWKRLKNTIQQFNVMRRTGVLVRDWDEHLNAFSIPHEQTALLQFDAIIHVLPEHAKIWAFHILNSASSGVWNLSLCRLIAGSSSVWTSQHCADVAFLLSRCDNVISAQIPRDMQAFVNAIRKEGLADHVLSMSAEEATRWVQSKESGKIGEMFAEFLQKHGHRCVREMELMVKSWQTEPVKLLRAIQLSLKCAKDDKNDDNTAEVDMKNSIESIKTPTTAFTRLLMRWLLPIARNGVGHREFSKSLMVKQFDVFKKAFWRLAKLLVQEGRLPDEELMFFFTIYEIDSLLNDRTQSARLIKRARDRQRILPKQRALKYPRMNWGHPQPLDTKDSTIETRVSSLKVKGLPVSLGKVEGKARVITTVQQATSIQRGDILIVPFTDVGWSPYFAVIAGIVTELGGLLSHGAVVAREYGLPCVVNIPHATTLFHTGDYVLLNGTDGTIERLQV